MAIQIRRGSNAEWELNKSNIVAGEPAIALDTERTFVGTGSGTFVELAKIGIVADAYNTASTYAEGDYCDYQGTLYKANTTTTGAWDSTAWDAVTVAEAIINIEESVADIEADTTDLYSRTEIHLGTDSDGRFCIITVTE